MVAGSITRRLRRRIDLLRQLASLAASPTTSPHAFHSHSIARSIHNSSCTRGCTNATERASSARSLALQSLQSLQSLRPISSSAAPSMFIQTQNTPNPSSLMFVPGRSVMDTGSASFQSAREAMASPLAKKLFLVDGVSGVFFSSDFITVSKTEDHSWSTLKPEIFAAITEFYSSNEPVMYDTTGSPESSDMTIHDDDSEVVAMIKELLETRIRPAVQEDGGDIMFVGYEEDTGVVTIKMLGACDGCPSSSITLKSGIENMIKHYVPEVREVREAEADEAELEGQKAFDRLEQHLSS
jgi:Fe-S cluster biogenesis protein NfuA